MCGQVPVANPFRPAIRVRGGNEGDVEQAALERLPPLREIGNRQRAERITVPGAPACNKAAFARHIAGGKILNCDFQCRFHRLRTTARVQDVGEHTAAQAVNGFRQLLQGRAGKKITIAACNLLHLLLDRRVDLRVAVT